MASFTLTSSTIGSTVLATMNIDANAYTFVAPGVTVGNTSGSVITGSGVNQTVDILGSAWSAYSNTVYLSGASGLVNVAASGQVTNSDRTYISALNMGNGGAASSVYNAGQISGGSGVYSGHGLNLHNSGLIQSIGSGMTILDTGVTAGVLLYSSVIETSLIVNSGTIRGSALRADSLHGTSSFAIYEMQYDTALGHTTTVRNSGLLDGTVWLGTQIDKVFNTGLIEGQVNMGTGDDLVSNAGTITGDVFLEADDDRFVGYGSGLVMGVVNGAIGLDTLLGGGSGDMLLGDADADLLNGRGGDDTLQGGSGADQLLGGDDHDVLDGGTEVDTLRGGSGDDTISGGDGSDSLLGGVGDDSLIGGLGNDNLTGNAGADIFVFQKVADSRAAPNGDTINDFVAGQDVIDLTGVFAGTLSFQGTGAFAGGGTASVRYGLSPGGLAIVQVDTNGDSVADMRIILNNTPSLAATDFIL